MTTNKPFGQFTFGASQPTANANTSGLATSGGLFDTSNVATQPAATTGLFGSPVLAQQHQQQQPLFGTPTQQQQQQLPTATGGLFGGGILAASSPAQQQQPIGVGGAAAIPSSTTVASTSFTPLQQSQQQQPLQLQQQQQQLQSASATTSCATSISTPANPAAAVTTGTTTYKKLATQINKWTHELDVVEAEFQKELQQVRERDVVLFENAELLAGVQLTLEDAELDQTRLEQEVELLESQQRDLETNLEALEAATPGGSVAVGAAGAGGLDASSFTLDNSSYAAGMGAAGAGGVTADQEREQMMQRAQRCQTELQDIATDVATITQEMNELVNGGGNTKTGNKTGQSEPAGNSWRSITKILNSHDQTIQWIFRKTEEMRARLEAMPK